jgi:hypothetical protein
MESTVQVVPEFGRVDSDGWWVRVRWERVDSRRTKEYGMDITVSCGLRLELRLEPAPGHRDYRMVGCDSRLRENFRALGFRYVQPYSAVQWSSQWTKEAELPPGSRQEATARVTLEARVQKRDQIPNGPEACLAGLLCAYDTAVAAIRSAIEASIAEADAGHARERRQSEARDIARVLASKANEAAIMACRYNERLAALNAELDRVRQTMMASVLAEVRDKLSTDGTMPQDGQAPIDARVMRAAILTAPKIMSCDRAGMDGFSEVFSEVNLQDLDVDTPPAAGDAAPAAIPGVNCPIEEGLDRNGQP